MRSLRVQLAVLGFLSIYLPALALFTVTIVTHEETIVENGEISTVEQVEWPSLTVRATVLVLGPLAAALAWWWAGRAVRPLNQVRAVAEDIEATDLSRRIGLTQGSSEAVALAASFDAMLDRLERAAETQRRLIEETSHELRTPLAVLATNADVLLAHPNPTSDDYRRGLLRSRAAALRLQATIDGLLAEARQRGRTLDRQPVDLMALVHGVTDEAEVLAQAKRVQLQVSGPLMLAALVDEPTVRRAVGNLVDNALRFAPEGTTIEVTVAMDGGEAAIVVTDHGPGIPADEQERAFERFHGTGTGLGLPIARQVALAHGGSLTLRSPGPAGDGCAFRLSLPAMSQLTERSG